MGFTAGSLTLSKPNNAQPEPEPEPEPQAYQEDKSVRWNMERGLVVPEPPRLAEQR